ncbi:L-threonylcarbamoyladenylate synthase [Millionella massiliensis]|uniref:L-threonylcarbamoyladenylate synthase n=1 Tax=Millionella massiliensis TaxID=1871023 RepID=UPI0008DA8934|nr:L-threonylcarbamoyladenylate synthase [Millionella massiliensis]
MIIKLYPENPNERTVRQVVDLLRRGGVIVYPTDTVYALGCALDQPKAIERLRSIRGGKDSSEMSIVCSDISEVAEYARVDNLVFKLLKHNLPGPFTFILPASSKISDKVMVGRKTVGIRIPDNSIARAIVEALGEPLVTTSVRTDDVGDEVEYITDPELIHERYAAVDAVVDGGMGDNFASTVVDCTTSGEVEILRQGRSELEF